MSPLLRIEGLGRSFGDKVVLRHLSLEADAGDCVAIVGRNGAGKTTLLKVLATLLLPTSGDAWIAQHSLAAEPHQARKHIAWVPASDRGLFGRLTGRENLFLFGAMTGMRQREVEASLDRWRHLEALQSALESPFPLCSNGMKQMLHIVRALLPRPSVLLLDEPTRSLDAEMTIAVRALIREAARTALVLFSTHQKDERRDLASRELLLAVPGHG